MKISFGRGVVTAAVLVCATVAAAGEKVYPIVMDRPDKVGRSYRIIAKGQSQEQMVTSAAGMVLEEKSTDIVVELAAAVTVLDVDARGRASTLRLVVQSSSIRREGELSELLAPGTEVVASVEDGAESFTVAGEPLSPDIVKALAMVNSLPLADETDDDVFGTHQKKRVGDVWPVNAALASKSFRQSGLSVSEESVKGESRLVAAVRCGEQECLQLEAGFEMTGIEMPLPAGFKTVDARLEASFSGTYPVDTSRAKLDKSMKAAMLFKAIGKAEPGGADVTIALNSERTSSAKFVER